MYEKDWNSKQTSPKLETLHLKDTVQLIISNDIYDKIKYLCKTIAKDEWSGVLFYIVKGNIKDTPNCKIIVKDILLMDVGNKTATEFKWDEDIMNFQLDTPDAIDWIKGHIHSHNSMNVFFSGTDWNELNDNSPLNNIYLSLIVNNYMEMQAKVAFTADLKHFICKDQNGKDYALEIEGTEISPYMFVYDCIITKKEEKIKVSDEFHNRMIKIEHKAKLKEKEEKEYRIASTNNTNSIKNPLLLSDKNSTIPDWGGSKNSKDQNNKSSSSNSKPIGYGVWDDLKDDSIIVDKRDKKEDSYAITEIEEFAAFVIRLGNHEQNDDLINAIEDLEIANLNIVSVANTIAQSYGVYYETFFSNHKSKDTNIMFLETLEGLITELEAHTVTYDLITPIITSLKELGNRYEATLKDNQKIH